MIEIGKPFKVFILTPYCPISEVIAGIDIREVIIKFQYETKKMMFKTITNFLNKMKKIYAEDEKKFNYFNKISADDYLVFLSLAKVIHLNENNYKKKFTENALSIIKQNGGLHSLTNMLKENGKNNKYFISKQIYVHSKLMIVDDQFLILGSANINYRSMVPLGDSEICLSLYNPDKVKTFRKKLFKTHFNVEIDNPNNRKFWDDFYETGRSNNDKFESKKEMKEGINYYYIIFDKNLGGEIKYFDFEIGNKILDNYGKEYKFVPNQLFF
jgi:phosphatidylserine/phosphatidylglycerophosphate/cardiolipin synthase-like enzyme